MSTSQLTVAVNNPYPTADTATTPAGGTWGGATYSFAVVANYNRTGYDHDGMGWAAAGKFNGVVVAANDKVTLTFTAANPIPLTYDVYYQTAATFDFANSCTHAGSCAGTLATITITAPDDAHTTTFTAAQTSIVLDPVVWTGVPRKNASRNYDGTLGQISYRTDRINDALSIKLFGTSCTAAEFRTLQKISAKNVRCTITDGDTDAQILTYYGMFDPSSHLNSEGKTGGDISLTFTVESETYHA